MVIHEQLQLKLKESDQFFLIDPKIIPTFYRLTKKLLQFIGNFFVMVQHFVDFLPELDIPELFVLHFHGIFSV